MRHVDAHERAVGAVGRAQNASSKLFLRDDAACVLHEIREQVEFQSSERQQPSPRLGGEDAEVYGDGSETQARTELRSVHSPSPPGSVPILYSFTAKRFESCVDRP